MENQLNNTNCCLCGSDLQYEQCCGPYHLGKKTPKTAEALMRSRYSAYALQNAEYLMNTWDVVTRPKAIDFSKETVEWLRLEITNIKKGGLKDAKGLVEFKAYYRQDGEEHVMNELSQFVKRAGNWLYMDGVVKSIAKPGSHTNQGRNALCSCGSGKKYKRCCGAG